MQPEFDTIAHEYDATFSFTAVGRLLRERVWYFTGGLSRRNPSAQATGTVLEINCGTGEDALWLAKKGWQTISTDASTEMVAITQAKIEQAGLAKKATARSCAFAEIAQIPESNFDLIFSNFGGLNCVSPTELSHLGPIFAQKLKPGGKFIAVVMSRFCAWEILYFLLKRKPGTAFRRWSKKPVKAQLEEQTSIDTWYYSPKEFQTNLQFKGLSSKVIPIGFWLPPSYLNPFFEKRPLLLAFLNFLEKNYTPSWLAFAGDHFLICIEKSES